MGQRPGGRIKLCRGGEDSEPIAVAQSKTGAALQGSPKDALRAILDAAKAT